MSANRVRERTNKIVAALAAAYLGGLLALMTLIVFVESGRGAGFAIAWILVVLFYARNTLRCPLCSASVLNAPVGKAIGWLTGSKRTCARCRADYDEALAAKSAQGRVPTDPAKDKTAN